MTGGPDRRVCDGRRLRWLFAAGLAWLERNQGVVDALNVFPRPRWRYRQKYGVDHAQRQRAAAGGSFS